MSYRAEISRASPAAILMVIDQSTSMSHRLEGGQTKAAFLADVANKALYTIITNCSKSDGVRDYFFVGVIAYSGTSARNGFEGFGTETLHPISRVAEKPLRIETRLKKMTGINDEILQTSTKFPIWLEPNSRGKTSMCAGLTAAANALQNWCEQHPNSYPPTVLHVTDGHPTDGDPEPIAAKLRSLGTEDGACLVFNLHVDIGSGKPLVFPNDERLVGDRFGRSLFRMSSPLPPHVVKAANNKGYQVRSGARGFVFNAGMADIADFFDIGTRPAVATDK